MDKDTKWIKYGKLLSGLIHNLNTPLMGISGRVELLQINMGENKSLTSIISQVEKINQMLTAVGYLVDKDITNKELDIDLATFMNHFFNFMNADMRYKHHILTKELNFEPYTTIINPSDLLYCIHTMLDYALNFLDEDTSINATSNDKGAIVITLTMKNPVKSDYDMATWIQTNIEDTFKNLYHIEHNVNENVINILLDV